MDRVLIVEDDTDINNFINDYFMKLLDVYIEIVCFENRIFINCFGVFILKNSLKMLTICTI